MSKQSTQPYKGARDFYPEDKQLQNWMFSKWSNVVETYGYQNYDAPILEPTDLYLMKGSEEIVNEQTYTFKDRGDRSVTVRTEMTPSVSRMIAARRQETPYPARWYSIPNLWRYERMQRGRLREFWQLNVDMFGVDSIYAELEMLQIINDIFASFKAKKSSYVIKLNSRKLINHILKEVLNLNDDQSVAVIRLIDRKNKMSTEDFNKQCIAIIGHINSVELLTKILEAKTLADLPDSLATSGYAQELTKLLELAKESGIQSLEFDITLMRGFDYYTDIVFEAFDTDPENNRSLLGGGRYDGLVGEFGVEQIPTIGFAIGDVGFMNFLNTHELVPKMDSSVDVAVLVRDGTDMEGAVGVANELREMGAATTVDISGKKIDKQFKSLQKTNVRFAVVVDDEEIQSEQYTLKDLVKGTEQKHSLQRIVSLVADHRN